MKAKNTPAGEGSPGHTALSCVCIFYAQLFIPFLPTKIFRANIFTNISSNIDAAVNLRKMLPALVYSATPRNDGLLIRTSAKSLRSLSLFFRHSTHFQARSLIDIAVVDRLRPAARFSINYLFFSATTNQRLLVQLFAQETSTIPSLSVPYANGQRYFASAGWLEREA